MRSRRHTLALLTAALCGCAHAGTASPRGSIIVQGDTAKAGTALVYTGNLRSNGNLATSGQTGQGLTRGDGFVVTGSVRLQVESDADVRAEITVKGPATQNGEILWAVATGGCHSGAVPIMPVGNFPPIHLTDGRGELDRTVSLPLQGNQELHVNIYTGSSQQEVNILSCAELTAEHVKR